MNQIELHEEIDRLIRAGTKNTAVDDVRDVITANKDARP